MLKLSNFLSKPKWPANLFYYFVQLKSASYNDLVEYLYKPTDPSNLGIVRCLFGLLMAIDIFEERGGSDIDIRWGHSEDCHFPLFPILRPLPYAFMCILYGVMWIGAIGIMLGLCFKISALFFVLPYWYLLLLDKSFWNNHSYLYGIVGILLVGSSAQYFFSVDSLLNDNIRNKPVPRWNYFILKYQFFILYFLAGLKKFDSEWLEGYSMTHLGEHWVFWPFRIILSTEQIDYVVVHWFGFVLDLTIGFWMLWELSRPRAMLVCVLFHLMNSRLFSIGMFPYVCLATIPLFCKEDWPKYLWKHLICLKGKGNQRRENQKLPNVEMNYIAEPNIKSENYSKESVNFRKKFLVFLLLSHMGLQVCLPYSHFITKGYNNWTNGLYGYSWDMMVHSWEVVLAVVKVVDNESEEEYFMARNVWAFNDRWTKHADMCLQYAECIRRNLETLSQENPKQIVLSKNISIYIDVWCSLNKRFQQRMYDSNYDLLKANWSAFQPVEWLLPVMSEYNNFRKKMDEISRHVHSWNNGSDVLFVADFPGMFLENYIGEDIANVSLNVLEGEVVFEIENETTMQSFGVRLSKGDSASVPEGYLHKIHTVSRTPSCYMYTFVRRSGFEENDERSVKMYSPFPLLEEFSARKEGLSRMFQLIRNATLSLLFGRPLEIRKKPRLCFEN